jgi:ABC-type Fe3+ transport system permease subunit
VVWVLFGSVSARSIDAAIRAFADPRQRPLIGNTLGVGFGVVGLSAVAGVPLGIILGRCSLRRASLPRFLLVLPLVLPSYVLALAWIVLFGARTAAWVYSLPAAIVVLSFSLYPLVMLAAEASLRSLSSRFEEAGRLVAPPRRVWLKITLPLMLPPLAASALIVFVLAISDFAVPSLLRVRVYTTEVFTAFAALYDFRLATMMALPLIGVATLASLAALTFARRPIVARADRGPAGMRWSPRIQQVAMVTAAAVGVMLMGLPVGALINEAASARAAIADTVSIVATRNSFLWSAIGASLVVIAGSLLGYWRTRAARPLAHAADGLWVALFAVPATVLGVGIIALWNRPGFAGDVYRSDVIVMIAYLGRFLPVGALLCAAFLQRVPSGAEEAAAISGAGWMRSLVHVVLPMAKKGLAAVWLMIFILVFGDVALAILLAPPGESTIPVRAYTLIANSPTPDVARLALIQILVSILPVAGIVLLLRERTERPA